MTTANIDVNDCLANGSVGNLTHVETTADDADTVSRVWFLFHNKRSGQKARSKAAGDAYNLSIDKMAVPIRRKNHVPLRLTVALSSSLHPNHAAARRGSHASASACRLVRASPRAPETHAKV